MKADLLFQDESGGFDKRCVDEECGTLTPYEKVKKLGVLALRIDSERKEIIFAVSESSQSNEVLARELVRQKYPLHSVCFHRMDAKDFFEISQNLKISEKIWFLTSRIRSLRNSQADIEKLWHFILETAIEERASDLHLESKARHAVFKIRKDGMMKEMAQLGSDVFELLRNKIKLESKLDISETRLPQDGRCGFVFGGKEYDFRISAVPVSYGESVVIRILYKQEGGMSLKDLDFSEENFSLIDKALRRQAGLILIAGPTGSGKSTTLYALLQALKRHEKKLVTIEDPIELQIPWATQVQINPDCGFGFAEALRVILRQDPDVIMVGEIRDEETLRLAVRSSLTGHLVLSTIHTNDCASTPRRLLDMGVEPYLLSSTLTAVISQRLLRRLCPHCGKIRPDSPREALGAVFTPCGCQDCQMSGFSGREAVFEVLEIDEETREFLKNFPHGDFAGFLREKGFKTMFEDGLRKAAEGICSHKEVLETLKK